MLRTTLLVTAALLAACQGPANGDATSQPTSQPTSDHDDQGGDRPGDLSVKVPSPFPGWDAYGNPFDASKVDQVIAYADLIADAEDLDGQELTVRAIVDEVCQTKGCWMTFTQGDQTMRVKFLDYAFFMPKDCSGKEVIIDGKFDIQVVPAEEVAHYLEDAGKFEEAAAVTEDQRQLTFMADAVLMMK